MTVVMSEEELGSRTKKLLCCLLFPLEVDILLKLLSLQFLADMNISSFVIFDDDKSSLHVFVEVIGFLVDSKTSKQL